MNRIHRARNRVQYLYRCHHPLHHQKPFTMTSAATQKNHNNLIFAPGATATSSPNSESTAPPSSSHPANQAAQFTLATLHRSNLHPDPFIQFHRWFNDPQLANTVPETCCLSTASLPSGRVSARMVYLKTLESAAQSYSHEHTAGSTVKPAHEPGFVVYSNFGETSRKSHDLKSNPYASLTFWFKTTERQVRIEGKTERLTSEESQVYFDTRARGSRIGAWASRQSAVLPPTKPIQAQKSTVTEHNGGRSNEKSDCQSPTPPQHIIQSPEQEDDGRAHLDAQVHQTESRFSNQDHIPVPPFWGGLRLIPDTIEFWQGRESRLHDRFRYTLVSDADDVKETEVDGGEGDTRAVDQSTRRDHRDVVQGESQGSGSGKRWQIERLSP